MTPYMKTIFQQKKNWSFDQNQWVGPLKGGTQGTPIMPRDVCLSDSKCWNGGHEWVKLASGMFRLMNPDSQKPSEQLYTEKSFQILFIQTKIG